MTKFDPIVFDDHSLETWNLFQAGFRILEHNINGNISSSRERSAAITKLEESYMWIGRAIRNDQLAREEAAREEKKAVDGL